MVSLCVLTRLSATLRMRANYFRFLIILLCVYMRLIVTPTPLWSFGVFFYKCVPTISNLHYCFIFIYLNLLDINSLISLAFSVYSISLASPILISLNFIGPRVIFIFINLLALNFIFLAFFTIIYINNI